MAKDTLASLRLERDAALRKLDQAEREVERLKTKLPKRTARRMAVARADNRKG